MIWHGSSFHMLICHLYIFFAEVSVKVFGPFAFLLLLRVIFYMVGIFRTSSPGDSISSDPALWAHFLNIAICFFHSWVLEIVGYFGPSWNRTYSNHTTHQSCSLVFTQKGWKCMTIKKEGFYSHFISNCQNLQATKMSFEAPLVLYRMSVAYVFSSSGDLPFSFPWVIIYFNIKLYIPIYKALWTRFIR